MILHIISQPPSHPNFEKAIQLATSTDKIILLGDACYAAIQSNPTNALLNACKSQCFALDQDLSTRGISPTEHFIAISIDTFVELTAEADKTVSWY